MSIYGSYVNVHIILSEYRGHAHDKNFVLFTFKINDLHLSISNCCINYMYSQSQTVFNYCNDSSVNYISKFIYNTHSGLYSQECISMLILKLVHIMDCLS